MLSSASCGMPVGYSAILLPQLKISNDSMQINDEMGSWIASLHSAATPVGSLLSGIFMDRFGRKVAMQISSTPLIVGWLIIGLAQNHILLLVGRLVAGISAGLAAAAGQVFIGEISEPHLRGIFSSGPFASYSFGILLVYALGFLLHWREVAGLSAIPPVTALAIYFFLPESPVWLVRRGRIEEAKASMLWLRGGDLSKAKEETEQLIHRCKVDLQEERATLTILLQPEVLKPLLIVNCFNVAQILSGTYLIVFYAVDILRHVQGGERVNHFLAAVLTACVRFLFSIMAGVLLTLIGRRTLAISSAFGTGVSATLLAIILLATTPNRYFFKFTISNCLGLDYIPALLILVYVASNTMGFMILPGVLVSELFPAKIRGLVGGLSFMIFNLLLFAVAKVFPLTKSYIGVSGVFWIFGGVSFVACVFLWLTLPETKALSLAQIEDYFKTESLLWGRSSRRHRWSDSEAQLKLSVDRPQ
nr:unnamed protein product [Callosobruchus analis]